MFEILSKERDASAEDAARSKYEKQKMQIELAKMT